MTGDASLKIDGFPKVSYYRSVGNTQNMNEPGLWQSVTDGLEFFESGPIAQQLSRSFLTDSGDFIDLISKISTT